MAKTSIVERNKKRERMAKSQANKRSKLKSQLMDRSTSPEERFEAALKLAKSFRLSA